MTAQSKSQKKKLLIITPEPESGASSRLRAIDLIGSWGHQFDTIHLSFLSERTFQLKDTQGRIPAKVLSVLLDSLIFVFSYIRHLITCDILYIHRNIAPIGPPLLESLGKLCGKKLVYDFDDAIYLNPATAVNQWLGPLKMNAYRTRKLIQMADRVVAGNSHLAEYARPLNEHVEIIPTSLDLKEYDLQKDRKNSSSHIVIGWIGGPGTSIFVAEKMPLLESLLDQHASLRIELIGFPGQIDHPQILVKKWSLETEKQDLSNFDIGINPLQDNAFTRGKCGFKNIQYMALGIACIASPVGICADQITHQVNGLLATTDTQWSKALNSLINDSKFRLGLAEQGRLHAQQYDREKAADQLLQIFNSL